MAEEEVARRTLARSRLISNQVGANVCYSSIFLPFAHGFIEMA